jgi:hypothetical protein
MEKKINEGVFRKGLSRMNDICETKWFPLLFIPIATAFLLVFSKTTSPISISEGCDSAVFKSMGQAIWEGKVIYRDIFDNKGPVLYIINALGWGIAGRTGIFLLQIIGFSVFLSLMFKTARLFTRGLWSFVSVIIALFIYTSFIFEGNQCEEWMIYAFAPAIYLSMRWYCDLKQDAEKAFSKRRVMRDGLFYGLVFAFTVFIRPNDAVSVMGGLI